MNRLTFVAAVAAILGLLAGFALKAGTTASTAQTTVPTSAPHWQSFSTTSTEFVTIDGSQVSVDLNQPTTMLFLANVAGVLDRKDDGGDVYGYVNLYVDGHRHNTDGTVAIFDSAVPGRTNATLALSLPLPAGSPTVDLRAYVDGGRLLIDWGDLLVIRAAP
jgi:hypothetical protein